MSVCNQQVFSYDSDKSYLIIIMVMGAVMGAYLTLRMFKLCFSAFSYANFHIHQTYKFYALALIALAFAVSYHKNQYDHLVFIDQPQQSSVQMQNGFKLLYVLFGILSMYTTQLLYTLNGLTWLLITFGCDYSADGQVQSRISTEDFTHKSAMRKKMQFLKIVIMYIVFPLLTILSAVGVLEQSNQWCNAAKGTLLTSGFITIIIFSAGAGSFLAKRYKDATVSFRTKLAIGYLLLAINIRQIYFIVTIFVQFPMFDQGYIVILFTTLCVLLPLLIMSILSQRQLQNQKCALLKSSEVFLFKSIAV